MSLIATAETTAHFRYKTFGVSDNRIMSFIWAHILNGRGIYFHRFSNDFSGDELPHEELPKITTKSDASGGNVQTFS